MRPLLLLLIALLGTTGCDPCRDLDARFAPPALRPVPADAQPQLEVQVSLPGLSVRMGDAFRPGAIAQPGATSAAVRWTHLALQRSDVLTAVVSIVVASPDGDHAGTVRIPVEPTLQTGPGSVRVVFEASGPPEARIDGVDGAGRAAVAAAIKAHAGAWIAAPAVDVMGWFRPGQTLPIEAVDLSWGKGVLTLQLATGLDAAPLTVADRARRPGMADDVTITASLSLMAALADGGWLPMPAAGPGGGTEPVPTWPAPPPGWQVRAGTPTTGDQGVRVPVIARRTDQCSFVAGHADVAPGVALGFLGWHAPRGLEVTERRGAGRDVPDHMIDALVRAALAGLAAPLSPAPVLGPATVDGVRGPLNLVRTEGDGLLLDGLLAPPRARPDRGEPPRIPTGG